MNNGLWTQEQKDYLSKNVERLTLQEIASNINKTERAVRLYCHRNRLIIGEKVKNNLILQLLTVKFGNPEYFMPNKDFYKAIDITQKRWWDLFYGRKQVTAEEYLAISIHLKVTPQEAFETRQLNLFENKNENI